MVETIDKSNRGTKYNVVILGRAYSPHSHSAAQYRDGLVDLFVDMQRKGKISADGGSMA